MAEKIKSIATGRSMAVASERLHRVDKDKLPERWQSKIVVVPWSGCWIWTGALSSDGYGSTKHNGKTTGAHRHIYEFLLGEIPKGLELDHLCRVRCCVNPEHIEPVTTGENQLRGVPHRKRKEYCDHGHKMTPENTMIRRRKRVSGIREYRSCRACHNARSAPSYWRRKKAGLLDARYLSSKLRKRGEHD